MILFSIDTVAPPDPNGQFQQMMTWMSMAIAGLCSLVSAMLLRAYSGLKEQITEQGKNVTLLQLQQAQLVTRTDQHTKDILGLQTNTLTKELFLAETKGQNERIEDVKYDVQRIDRGLSVVQGPRYESASSIRRPIPREDPPSDPPLPPRPRQPSRPGGR